MALPIYQTTEHSMAQSLNMLQTNWAQQLNPVITNPANQGILLKNVSLINGTTVVNHMLGRKLQGWALIRKRAAAEVYDAQDSSSTPALTLTLISDSDVVVDLLVF